MKLAHVRSARAQPRGLGAPRGAMSSTATPRSDHTSPRPRSAYAPRVSAPDTLGKVEWLDIRAVWPNEAVSFTPWLLDNPDVLGDTLGIEVQLEEAEHSVGGFSLDLIGRDLKHEARLIVENQIEQSDHRHLGQLLTYTAGTDAATIVWIARAFRDEHRVALDWLNEHTGEEIRFFGVAVRALRIGDSAPAPFFELVAKPNTWQKSVRRIADSQSPEASAYRAFWAPLRDELLRERPEVLVGRAEPKSLWFTINSPIPKSWIQGEIGAGELRGVLELSTGDREENLNLLAQLEAQRDALEEVLGPLEFNPGTHRCKILRRYTWQGRLIDQLDRHDEARAWFRQTINDFRSAFEAVA